MSFASSSNSALIPILPKYPTTSPNAVGYVRVIDIITDVEHPSGTTLQTAFATLSLANGIWLLSGVIDVSLVAAGFPLNVSANVLVNGVINSIIISYGVSTYSNAGVTISAVISSNQFEPNVQLGLQVSCESSTGVDWFIDSGSGVESNLKLVRIA